MDEKDNVKEARSWREWTGIGSLYQSLMMEELVTVTKIEFLESHVPYHAAVFHYIVLVHLQVRATFIAEKILLSFINQNF